MVIVCCYVFMYDVIELGKVVLFDFGLVIWCDVGGIQFVEWCFQCQVVSYWFVFVLCMVGYIVVQLGDIVVVQNLFVGICIECVVEVGRKIVVQVGCVCWYGDGWCSSGQW